MKVFTSMARASLGDMRGSMSPAGIFKFVNSNFTKVGSLRCALCTIQIIQLPIFAALAAVTSSAKTCNSSGCVQASIRSMRSSSHLLCHSASMRFKGFRGSGAGAGAGAAAFTAQPAFRPSTALFNGPVKGAGGMFDTRDPDAMDHEDPRKSIGAAPSFEEYMRARSGGAAAAPAPAPATPPPAPATPSYSAPSYAAPAAPAAPASSGPVKGAGGMFDTRDPEAMDHEDPRKSIGAAPSFEEYMKSRQQ